MSLKHCCSVFVRRKAERRKSPARKRIRPVLGLLSAAGAHEAPLSAWRDIPRSSGLRIHVGITQFVDKTQRDAPWNPLANEIALGVQAGERRLTEFLRKGDFMRIRRAAETPLT